MRQPKYDKTLVNRASWAHGQLGGIINMMSENRPIEDVLIQLYAARGALDHLIYPHLDSELRCDLLHRLDTLSETKNLNPQTLARIAEIRTRLDSCTTEQIPRLYYQLSLLEHQIESIHHS